MFDPRDDTRERGDDSRERAYEGREHTGDPRDAFLHDVDLPLAREREYVLDRDQVRAWGLTNRRGQPLTSQAIGMLLRNQPGRSVPVRALD